jgi:hypothetical protein
MQAHDAGRPHRFLLHRMACALSPRFPPSLFSLELLQDF